MLDVNISSQTYTFLCSLLVGIILGALYTVFKCIRTLFGNRKIHTVVCDIVYMLIFTLITYLFSIGFTDGFVRYYVVLGELAGLMLFKFTLGILIHKLFVIIFRCFSKIYRKFQKNISVFAKKLLKANHNMLYNKVNKKAKFVNKRKGTRTNGA